jgi:hypothetical protein
MKPKQPTASYNDPRKQREAVELAQRIISGEIGIVAGCRHLSRLGHDMVEDWQLDRDFVVVGRSTPRRTIFHWTISARFGIRQRSPRSRASWRV